MKENIKTGVYTRNGKDVPFNFYTNLSVQNKVAFVNYVTSLVVDENYNSIIRDMIFDFEIIAIFTDVDITDVVESTNTLQIIEELLAETNIVDIVKANVDIGLIDELSNAVDKNIEYKTGIHRNPLVDSIAHFVTTLENKFSTIDVDGMMAIGEALNSISSELTPENIINAYSKTDFFKENFARLLAERQAHDDAITKAVKKDK